MNRMILSVFLALAVVSASAQGQRRRPQAAGNQEIVRVGGQVVQVKKDLTLSEVTDDNLVKFMKNTQAVNMLVRCFSGQECKSFAGRSLVSDVRKLKRGGVCGGDVCTNNQDKANVERLVKKAIRMMQKYHKDAWRTLIPHISHIL